MDLREANNKFKKCENDIRYYEKIREIAFQNTQPKSMNMSSDKTDGGQKANVFDKYLISIEEIDVTLTTLYQIRDIHNEYIIGEMDRLAKFEKPKKKIIMLREMGDIKGKELTWEQIANLCDYSTSQAKKIYYKDKKFKDDTKRYV